MVYSIHATTKRTVDVLITLKTEVFYVRQLVQSLLKVKPDTNYLEQRIIFVDDGSPLDTQDYISSLCREAPLEFICLATTEEEKGYTFAVNKGFMHGEGYSEAIVC